MSIQKQEFLTTSLLASHDSMTKRKTVGKIFKKKTTGLTQRDSIRLRQTSLFTNYDTLRQELLEDDEDLGPTILKWSNIKLSIKNPKNKKIDMPILRGISGFANKGEILGIIGASGGGKTTLLSMLSGRILKIPSLKSKSTKWGLIQFKKFAGFAWSKRTLQVLLDNTSYVLQEDLLVAQETVAEALHHSAVLRSRKRSNEERIKMADKILRELDLLKVSDSLIGDESIRGISGGEKKRVSIGLELVTSPNVLMLDEPTTGLDSSSAYSTIALLKRLANKDRCVICSLHSPSSEIVGLLDRVMVLGRGRVAYFGKTKDMVKYLNSIGQNLPKYTNTCDYILQKLHHDPMSFIEQWEEYVDDHYELFEEGDISVVQTTIVNYKYYVAPICTQVRLLLRRNFLMAFRNKQFVGAKIMGTIVRNALIGALWFREKNLNHYSPFKSIDVSGKGITNCQNRYGALFYAIFADLLSNVMTSILTFPTQKVIFVKERSSNWYYTFVWLSTKWTVDIPLVVLTSVIETVILKYMVNFHADLFEIGICMLLVGLVADSYGLFIGTIAKTLTHAVASIPISIIPMMLLGGFLINIRNIPVYLRWYRWINPVWYATNIWGYEEFNYKKGSIADGYTTEFKNMYSINSKYWRNIYYMIILFVGWRLLAVFVLVIKNGI